MKKATKALFNHCFDNNPSGESKGKITIQKKTRQGMRNAFK